MKVLVTGVRGQLGFDVVKVLNQRGIECLGADIHDFDITDPAATHSFIVKYAPDAVIHCSAYTAVDKAEDNPGICRRVNVDGPANIAATCTEIGAKMVYISTDYVFPGDGEKPFEVDSPTGPLNVYGSTKLDGEVEVKKRLKKYFIVRTSWVFGLNGHNFVKTMLKIGRERPEVSVVCDQIGSPTNTADLAPLLCDMIVGEKYGTYHATNEGYCSWAEFTQEIFRLAGYQTKVNFIPSSAYPSKAKRPLNSRLSKKSLDDAGFRRLPTWQESVAKYICQFNSQIKN